MDTLILQLAQMAMVLLALIIMATALIGGLRSLSDLTAAAGSSLGDVAKGLGGMFAGLGSGLGSLLGGVGSAGQGLGSGAGDLLRGAGQGWGASLPKQQPQHFAPPPQQRGRMWGGLAGLAVGAMAGAAWARRYQPQQQPPLAPHAYPVDPAEMQQIAGLLAAQGVPHQWHASPDGIPYVVIDPSLWQQSGMGEQEVFWGDIGEGPLVYDPDTKAWYPVAPVGRRLAG